MKPSEATMSKPVREIRRVLIVGAGWMGREIGLQCARHGVEVTLYDVTPSALEGAAAHLRAAGHPVETRTDLHAAGETDLVIECVPENLELKRQVFAQLSEHSRPETILATNTSSLVPSQFADSCRYPGRLAAMHFHLPVAICKIVDLMPHPGTDPDVVPSLDAFTRRIDQVPIRYAREHHGYIFNSIFGAMERQAMDLVIDGVATLEDVDRSWMGVFCTRIGPFGMFDGIGLDSLLEVIRHWAEALDDEAGRRRVEFLRRWVDQGWLGHKTGRGFYTYPNPAYKRRGFVKGQPEAVAAA